MEEATSHDDKKKKATTTTSKSASSLWARFQFLFGGDAATQNEIARLKEQLRHGDERFDGSERDRGELVDKNRQVMEGLLSFRDLLTRAQSFIANTENDNAATRAEIAQLKEELTQAIRRAQHTEKRQAYLETQLSWERRRNAHAERMVRDAEEETVRLTGERDECEQERARVARRLRRVEEELEASRAETAEMFEWMMEERGHVMRDKEQEAEKRRATEKKLADSEQSHAATYAQLMEAQYRSARTRYDLDGMVTQNVAMFERVTVAENALLNAGFSFHKVGRGR
jgi:chromosome segregation ATPase